MRELFSGVASNNSLSQAHAHQYISFHTHLKITTLVNIKCQNEEGQYEERDIASWSMKTTEVQVDIGKTTEEYTQETEVLSTFYSELIHWPLVRRHTFFNQNDKVKLWQQQIIIILAKGHGS